MKPGLLCEVTLGYDPTIALEKGGRPLQWKVWCHSAFKERCVDARRVPARNSHPQSGKICTGLSAWSLLNSPTEPKMPCCCGWYRL